MLLTPFCVPNLWLLLSFLIEGSSFLFKSLGCCGSEKRHLMWLKLEVPLILLSVAHCYNAFGRHCWHFWLTVRYCVAKSEKIKRDKLHTTNRENVENYLCNTSNRFWTRCDRDILNSSVVHFDLCSTALWECGESLLFGLSEGSSPTEDLSSLSSHHNKCWMPPKNSTHPFRQPLRTQPLSLRGSGVAVGATASDADLLLSSGLATWPSVGTLSHTQAASSVRRTLINSIGPARLGLAVCAQPAAKGDRWKPPTAGQSVCSLYNACPIMCVLHCFKWSLMCPS